jgi:ribosome-binding factor A
VGEELRHALVGILRDIHAADPALQDINVTVTEVRISPDLGHATAFVVPFAGQNKDETLAALNRAAPYFRTRLVHAVELRRAPRISFSLDTSFGYAAHIEELLRAPAVKRDIEAEAAEPPDAEA